MVHGVLNLASQIAFFADAVLRARNTSESDPIF